MNTSLVSQNMAQFKQFKTACKENKSIKNKYNTLKEKIHTIS